MNNIKFKGGLAYSTDKNLQVDAYAHEQHGTLPAAKQRLRVRIDNKKHAGKTVTIVEKYIGTHDDMEALAKQLKASCGCGGSVKEGIILLQGSVVEKVKAALTKQGYGLMA